jgi:excisionase family DNA binding protein
MLSRQEDPCQPSRVCRVSQVLLPCASVAREAEQQQWFTLEQAAGHLQVSKAAVYKWIREGRLAYYEFPSGRGRRFRRQDLDRLLQRRGGEKAGEDAGTSGDGHDGPAEGQG